MENEKNPNEKIVSKTFIGIAIASGICGAINGFCDGAGIYNPILGIRNSLAYDPAIVQGILGIFDGISIAEKGKQISGNYPSFLESNLEKMVNAKDSPINNRFYGAVMGGVGEAATAAVETLIGYGIGYCAGKISRTFS